jgi:NADPH2:quinone reductase
VYYTAGIFGNPRGTDAALNVAPAAIVARKPKHLDHISAAALPLAGGTAWGAMVRRLKVHLGETVLIQGGTGGVGPFAVQIGKAVGARVLTTASSANQQALRDLSAPMFPSTTRKRTLRKSRFTSQMARAWDAVFDSVGGGDLIARSLAATRPFGGMACILLPAVICPACT